ncbi:hypothetical protein GE107_08690 [Cohnella sp. CFH 77786]|uniref:hypothetical protein n=1 Tax=Cohnella sp. CFH 77786 TaxID=2662265 RepID=UPI001C610537|nr:hypothetical protein [Cohnella sp. CFH 77786]MBW5446136.1 hypothetical protein [Cohnella sp. CFH 77786]
MRQVRAAGLVAIIAVAVVLVFYGLWQREHRDDYENKRRFGFPVVEGVTEIRVLVGEGKRSAREIKDRRIVEDALRQLKQARRSFFEDPEPAGVRYRVQFFLEGREEPKTFELNDLRGSGHSNIGKIYPQNPERNEVWMLPASLVGLLVDTAEPAGG